MDLRLKGRVAVITGPAKGMGAAITKAFAAEGAARADRPRHRGDRAGGRRRSTAAGGEAIVVPCDLTDAGAMRARRRCGQDAPSAASTFW